MPKIYGHQTEVHPTNCKSVCKHLQTLRIQTSIMRINLTKCFIMRAHSHSIISSPSNHSVLYTSPHGRPIHFNTNATSQRNIKPHCKTMCKSYAVHNFTTVYYQLYSFRQHSELEQLGVKCRTVSCVEYFRQLLPHFSGIKHIHKSNKNITQIV